LHSLTQLSIKYLQLKDLLKDQLDAQLFFLMSLFQFSYFHTTDSPDDEHHVAGNMNRIEINVRGKIIVRQAGLLPELYQYARSTEHKILQLKGSKIIYNSNMFRLLL
jgi:hypothetical protein